MLIPVILTIYIAGLHFWITSENVFDNSLSHFLALLPDEKRFTFLRHLVTIISLDYC